MTVMPHCNFGSEEVVGSWESYGETISSVGPQG